MVKRILLLLLVLTTALTLAACGGEVKTKTNPKAKAKNNTKKTALKPKLPEAFPDDFPIYTGATLDKVKWNMDSNGNLVYLVLWRVTDNAGTVKDFYLKNLAARQWRIIRTGPDFIQFKRSGDTGVSALKLYKLKKQSYLEVHVLNRKAD